MEDFKTNIILGSKVVMAENIELGETKNEKEVFRINNGCIVRNNFAN